MNIKPLPLSFFVDHLNSAKPFTAVRYGDGELQCALGMDGQNCDGVKYVPSLAAALRKTLEQPKPYLYSIGPKVTKRDNEFGRHCRVYMAGLKIDWHDSETLLNASVAGELRPFTEALGKRKVLLVGPEHLRRTGVHFVELITVPSATAWDNHETILRTILRDAYSVDTILFSAGPTAKVLIWELFDHLGQTHCLVDCGSLFDTYCGVDSRSYARKLSPEQKARLKEQNFPAQGTLGSR